MFKKKTLTSYKKYFFFSLLALVVLVSVAYATSTISSSGITTPSIIGNTSFTGTIINFTTPDTSIKLYTSSHTDFGNNNGESLELWSLVPTSKPYIGWYGYDRALDSISATGWIGCHYNLTNGNIHSHCSWETLDNSTGTPTINSHFEISYNGSQTRANIKFPSSDVQFISNQKLYFGDTKQISLSHNATSGDLDITGNSRVSILSASGIRMNNKDIVNASGIRLQIQALPTCNSVNLGYIAGNATGPYYCNSTEWRLITLS